MASLNTPMVQIKETTQEQKQVICCELYLPLAQGTLSKRTQGNYGSSLCIWKSENVSIKSCGGPTAFPAYKRGLLSHEEMQASWKVSRQASACVPFAVMDSQSPSPGLSCPLAGERKFREAGVIRQLSSLLCSTDRDSPPFRQESRGVYQFAKQPTHVAEDGPGLSLEMPTCYLDLGAAPPRSGQQEVGNGEKTLYKVVLHPRGSLLRAGGEESLFLPQLSLFFNFIKPFGNYYNVGALRVTRKSHQPGIPYLMRRVTDLSKG